MDSLIQQLRESITKVLNWLSSLLARPIHPLVDKNRRNILIGFLIILITVITYRWFFGAPQMGGDIKVVEVEQVTKQDIRQTARLIGTIHPKHATVLIAKTSGTLDSLITAGQSVKKGTLIAKIENADVEQNYDLSMTAESIAREQYERTKRLAEEGHTSKKNMEDHKNSWIEAQKTLALSKINLEKTQFLAPFDGIVGVFKIREGTQVETGDPVVSFYDPTSLTVDFDIPDSLISHIKDGQRIDIERKAYPLTHVQRMIDEETHMCPAYVDIACETCIIGTAVDLDITIQEKKDTIVISYEAVFLKNGKTFVYKIKDNKTVLSPVELGIREKEKVEITTGLETGDVIVSLQPNRLFPDAPVKIHNQQDPSK